MLDKIDPNLFLARPENLWKPPYARAVFGGQVLGQALAAASQTVAPCLDSDYFDSILICISTSAFPIYNECELEGKKLTIVVIMNAHFHCPKLSPRKLLYVYIPIYERIGRVEVGGLSVHSPRVAQMG